MQREVRFAALVSVGRHPITGRARRAEYDARAVELALSSTDAAQVSLIHAGEDASESLGALRSYIGMGLASLDLLRQPPGADVVPALEARLRELAPQVVLCGARSETGEASGMLPFLLAERLGWPVVSGLAAIESIDADSMTVLQALPRGQRRRLKVRLPAIATVDAAAKSARQSALGPARRGAIRLIEEAVVEDTAAATWSVAPARKRPKRLKIIKAASARDRFKAAAAKAEGGGGQVISGVPADAAAQVVLKLLREEGVLR